MDQIRAAVILALLSLLAVAGNAQSQYAAPWTPPPSAIHAITTSPGPVQSLSRQAILRRTAGTVDGTEPAPAPPRPVRPGTHPRTTAAHHTIVELVFVGVASNMGPGYPAIYLALPQGPGWRARICGPGGCVTRVSTDTGPERWTGRIADLNVHDFAIVSGQPWTRGLTSVSIVLEGRAP